MENEKMKRFRCKNGHIIGLIRPDGHSLNRLLYLRKSVDEKATSLSDIDVAAVIDSGDVTCTICGESRIWVPSPAALQRLLQTYRKETQYS